LVQKMLDMCTPFQSQLKSTILLRKSRVARFFLVQYTKAGENRQIATKLPNAH
jgi:hypothetical protein